LQEEIERLEREIDNIKYESTILTDGECMLNNCSSGNVDNLNRELIENMVDTIKIQWYWGRLSENQPVASKNDELKSVTKWLFRIGI